MKYVLDSSALMNMAGMDIEGELYTTPGIVGEIKDHRTKALFECSGIRVVEPGRISIARVEEESGRTGDSGVLSPEDISIIALARELGAEVVTDDYGVQNLCLEMGIGFMPVKNRKISKKFKRALYCPKCREIRASGNCGVCGSETVPKVVKIEDIIGSG